MIFQKAIRKKARLRLALTGPSGSGKTYGALLLANGLGGKIALIDTEKGSASLYSHIAEFDVLELLPPYSPERFIEAVKAAEKMGYETLIIDSITHEWSGSGGCLELVDEIAKSKYKGNSWSAWNDLTPRHKDFIDSILQSKMHVIATMRSKTETAQTTGDSGKKQVVKLGMKSEQRDGAEYEFTTVLDIVHDGHYAIASKDRTGLFSDKDPKKISEETGKILLAWLETGSDVTEDQPISASVPSAFVLNEKACADHVIAINDCRSMDELKMRFEIAWTDGAGDNKAQELFKREKDRMKFALSGKLANL